MNSVCKFYLIFLSFMIIALNGCSKVPKNSLPELQTVSHVDLDRYLGKWYEIARYPHSFEEGCYAATAFYEKKKDGAIQVTNQCRMGSLEGEVNEAVGRATVSDKKTNAKLKVQFFWPFKGNYWIVYLDPEYRTAVVSEPNRQFLWILSRTPKMNPETLTAIKEKLIKKGFDLQYLILTPQ